MRSTFRIGRISALSIGAALVLTALTLPGAASATTGIETSVAVRVVLTDKGAVWTPALKKLHPDTDTTFEVKVVNKTAQAHSFRLGYRETKVLPKGASQFFYYSFHVVGRTAWQVRHGTPQGAGQSGVFNVKLPKAFSGGALG
ncbi:MAG: hypothetical protein QOK14_775 [Frankiaceae bacterium]|nr:hypothetical protein [Frankiaceae bacterium]